MNSLANPMSAGEGEKEGGRDGPGGREKGREKERSGRERNNYAQTNDQVMHVYIIQYIIVLHLIRDTCTSTYIHVLIVYIQHIH